MKNLGLNNDITTGGRKFHVQTNYSESEKSIGSKVFLDGEVIHSKSLAAEGLTEAEVEARMAELHQELITEMEVLYYIYEKVKTVEHSQSANKLGLLFLQKRLFKEAKEQFSTAIKLDSSNPDYYANLGRAYLTAKEFDQAIEILQKGSSLGPYFADIQHYLGVAQLYKDNFRGAVVHLDKAIELNDEYTGANYHLAIAFLGLSLTDYGASAEEVEANRAKARELLDTMAKNGDDYHLSNFNRVKDLFFENKFEEALEAFKESDPADLLSQFMNIEHEFYLKFMYGGKGKDDDFIANYIGKLTSLLDENPDYADAHNNLGVAHLIQCRNLFLKALDEFRAALKINPKYERAEKNLKLAENDGKGFLILLRAILK
jgi:tetratricopeptide (TPR) repeat protein